MESLKFNGVQDTLEVFEDKIVITPRGVLGFLNKGIKGSKEIPMSSIVAIQLKPAGALLSGYLQFTIPGGNESKGGLWGAVSDENTFVYTNELNDQMVNLKTFIQERIGKAKNSISSVSSADEILKLKKLFDDGIITEKEFTDMKSKIIKNAA